jgi:hypothetical protein
MWSLNSVYLHAKEGGKCESELRVGGNIKKKKGDRCEKIVVVKE